MRTTEITRVQSNTRTRTREATVTDRVSTATLAVAGSAGLLVGLWSFTALAGGLVASGGPLSLLGSYFRAVSGL